MLLFAQILLGLSVLWLFIMTASLLYTSVKRRSGSNGGSSEDRPRR